MITAPLNDQECLGSITETVRTLVDQQAPELHTLARELGSSAAAIRWIRSLPQRDDVGEPGDGPRIDACAPPQRLRLPAPDPNCVERAALYLVLSEFLEPRPARRLATIDTPVGRHTLPVENGTPVVLDPRVPRNCARAGIDVLGAVPTPTDAASCASWVCNVAAEPAQHLPGGTRRVRRAVTALAGAVQGVPFCASALDDVALVLALAAREAPQWGPTGIRVVDRVAQAVINLQRGRCGAAPATTIDSCTVPRNAIELKVGRYRLRPAIPAAVGAALRTLGVVGIHAGTAVARAELAALGVTPSMLGVFESELNKGGLTIGALAKPTPPPHSFAALTSDALVARHLERAGNA